MIRGTTPRHIFNMPFDVSSIEEVRITYEQNGQKVLEKTENDCTMEGTKITVQLTQEETLKFEESRNVSLQLKVLTSAGDVMVTKVRKISCGRILNDEVLG